MRLNFSLLTIFLLITCSLSFSQRRSSFFGGKRKSQRRKSNKTINYINNIKGTFFLGTTKYVGDIAGRTDGLNKSRLSFNLGAQYRYNNRWSFRGDLGHVWLEGSDEFSKNPSRNLSFTTDIYELNAAAVYDILSFNKMYRRRYLITPYALIGFGAFHYNPKTRLEDGKTYSLRQYETEGKKYGGVSFSGQLGGGIRLKLTPHLDLGVELIYKKTFTDYLDDVSTIYPNDIASWSDPTRQQLSSRFTDKSYDQVAGKQRGNPDKKDSYAMLGFKLEYTLKVTAQKYNIVKNQSRFRMHKGIRKK